MEYSFNSKGNLEYRQDNLTSQKEQFIYDGMNRLTNWDIYQNNAPTAAKLNAQAYDTNGNIGNRSGLDNLTMNYGAGGKPHALTSISGKPESMPSDSLGVTYTDFKKIATLTEGNKNYTLTYGVDDERRMSVYKVNGSTRLTRYYLGDYEEEVDASGNVRKIHYLSGDAVLIRNNGKDSLLYGYADYQGSLIALTNESGTLVEQYAYDPWGNRRNPADWTASDTRTGWKLNRGYTGHEHLDAFAIINMNGRVYDPLTGLFFSPDPQLQDPNNWLNYNRYGYCLNNPLIYADPSGEIYQYIIAGLISAAIDYFVQVACNYAIKPNDSPKNIWLNNIDWFDVGTSFVVGGLTVGYSKLKDAKKVSKAAKILWNVFYNVAVPVAETQFNYTINKKWTKPSNEDFGTLLIFAVFKNYAATKNTDKFIDLLYDKSKMEVKDLLKKEVIKQAIDIPAAFFFGKISQESIKKEETPIPPYRPVPEIGPSHDRLNWNELDNPRKKKLIMKS